MFRDARFLSQLMVASGTPLIWHWKRATPPSPTLMDAGWVWNLGRAEKHTTAWINGRKAAGKLEKSHQELYQELHQEIHQELYQEPHQELPIKSFRKFSLNKN